MASIDRVVRERELQFPGEQCRCVAAWENFYPTRHRALSQQEEDDLWHTARSLYHVYNYNSAYRDDDGLVVSFCTLLTNIAS